MANSEVTVKINVDVEDAIKQLKAVGREARQTTQSVREAEAQGGTTINVNYTEDSGADPARISAEIAQQIKQVYETGFAVPRGSSKSDFQRELAEYWADKTYGEDLTTVKYRVKPHAQIEGVGVVIDDTSGKLMHQFRYFDGVSTAALTAELARREGVEEYGIDPYVRYELRKFGEHEGGVLAEGTGPARILVVTD